MQLNLVASMIVFSFVLVGCQPTTEGRASASSGSPAKFEIRDFKLDEQTVEFGGVSVNGRGTLIALDDSLKKGNVLVYLTVKQRHKADLEVAAALIMRDGLATIETRDYISKDDRGKTKIQYADWRMTGFVLLQEGVVVADGAASSPAK